MREIWVPVSSAKAISQNIEAIANNVANANTPGFKKDQMVFKEYLTLLEDQNARENTPLPEKEWRPEDFYKSYGMEDSFVKTDGSYTNFEQGQLTPTGNSMDFSIFGPGFFEVLTPMGNRYTRKGNFTINRDGFLVTDQGHFVLSKGPPPTMGADGKLSFDQNPEARKIQIGGKPFTISHQGEVFNADGKKGDLSIAEFHDLTQLKKEGSSAFINNSPDNIKSIDIKSAVHQGFLEQSNVNSITEMSNLINANRNFESVQRIIKTYDQLSGKAVNEIPKL